MSSGSTSTSRCLPFRISFRLTGIWTGSRPGGCLMMTALCGAAIGVRPSAMASARTPDTLDRSESAKPPGFLTSPMTYTMSAFGTEMTSFGLIRMFCSGLWPA